MKNPKWWDEFLTSLAVVYLFAFSYPAFVDPVPNETEQILSSIQWFVWVMFALDVSVGLARSTDRTRYLKAHPIEIISVALPMLRPLRLLRLVTIGSLVIQRIAVGKQFSIAIKVFLFSILIAYISAVQITIIERPIEGSNIKSFGDGLWWALTTVTTVGYGDRFPTSNEGRILAFALMLVGISLVGVITASVAAWFVKMVQNDNSDA
jgi:voltage-gated potassium channel